MTKQPWMNQPLHPGNGKSQVAIPQQFEVQVKEDDFQACRICETPERVWVPIFNVAIKPVPVIGQGPIFIQRPMGYVCIKCGAPYGAVPESLEVKKEAEQK